MNRRLFPALIAAVALTLPAAAQTPPAAPASPVPQQGAASEPVPLPAWFKEADTSNKGEVTRAEFLKYRLKTFESLDTNKDGKLTLDEFMKVAEPPFSSDVPGGMPLAERQARARAEFENLDTNRNGFIERGEAEAQIHVEFNQYDTDRDNKVTEPELRLIVQRTIQREAAERQQAEARRRQGLVMVSEFIDLQLRNYDQLDKNGDGKISQQEYTAIAGPADGPQAQGLPPFEVRRKIAMMKFAEIDTNKDGVLDPVEITAHAVQQFIRMDLNKDRFLSEDELKKDQEAEQARLRATLQSLMPAQPAPSRPAPAPQARPAQPAAPGLTPGLPQGTR